MIRVLLLRPSGPRNIGLALRAAHNFGPVELGVVAPADPRFDRECDFVEMSHGVRDPSGAVRRFDHLDDALADCAWSVGFTARMRQHRVVETFDDACVRGLRERAGSEGCLALAFGSEMDGFTAEEAGRLAELVRIPTSAPQRSINLGTAVAVVLSRLYREATPAVQSRKTQPLAGRDREILKDHLLQVLPLHISGARARAALIESIERVFSQAPLETRDAQAWHKLLRELAPRAGEP